MLHRYIINCVLNQHYLTKKIIILIKIKLVLISCYLLCKPVGKLKFHFNFHKSCWKWTQMTASLFNSLKDNSVKVLILKYRIMNGKGLCEYSVFLFISQHLRNTTLAARLFQALSSTIHKRASPAIQTDYFDASCLGAAGETSSKLHLIISSKSVLNYLSWELKRKEHIQEMPD